MQNTTRTLLTLAMAVAMVGSPAASTVSPVAGLGPATLDDGTTPQVSVETADMPGPGDAGGGSGDGVEPSDRQREAGGSAPGSVLENVLTGGSGDGSPTGVGHGTAGPGAVMDALDEGGLDEVKERFGWNVGSDHERQELVNEMQFQQASAGSVCPDSAPVRRFNVTSIQVDIVYNQYGQHDPNGRMYVLERNKQEVLQQVQDAPEASIQSPNPNATVPLVQPLTIRAHLGDCVKIDFDNGLAVPASMHVSGLPFNVSESDGMAVGDNPPSFAEPGEEVEYTWYASNRGTHFFGDAVNVAENSDPDPNASDGSLRSHGLFGAIVVEPKGTSWLDTETGEPLESGTRAIIEDPDGTDFREFVIYYHDGADVVNADGTKPTWPGTNSTQSLYTMNYRGDPMSARLKSPCPDCDVPENFYSSWVHGDPGGGDLVFNAYVGDPLKMRLVGAQSEEAHVHHQHGHRWKSTPGDPDANTIDSQTLNPGGTYEAVYHAGFGQTSVRPNVTYEEAIAEGGAGYFQRSAGDYIFHCHLFPHYASGMWSILRVNDKRRDDLSSLPDRDPPPEPTKDQPGFWNPNNDGPVSFVNGTKGYTPPNPPDPDLRPATALEEATINGSGITDPIVPGAPYADPCPENASVRRYNITVFQTNVTYNNAGDYDDTAWMFALTKNVEAIRNGSMRPRPLAVRANVGECVSVTLTNELPEDVHPNKISMHIHFVGYDVLGSDGVTLGYNYDEGVRPGGKIRYRWYADEQGTVFWHDHLSGIEKGMHGLVGSLIVEPKGSAWLNPYTGEPLEDGDGTKAIISPGNGSDFREQMLWYQDFVRLHDGDTGEPLNGPHSKDLEDQGSMGINYANAPFYRRDDNGSAYTFSSWANGDPQTPIIESYRGDPVRIRLLQGTFEEQHNFQIHGLDWQKEWHDGDSPLGVSQTIGTSEQFEFHLQSEADSRFPVHDYLYGSFTQADLWEGMWGLFRVWTVPTEHLAPLPDRGYPDRHPDEEVDENGNQRLDREELPEEARVREVDNSFGPVRIRDRDAVPPPQKKPGDPCPDGATTRVYNVTAFHHDVTYNDEGDHDPHGLTFALDSQVEAIRNGSTQATPLVLRANEGDCIEVHLTNDLDGSADNDHGHPRVPVDQDWNYSHRISLHPKGVQYDVLGSDGATVGMNPDQTVGPGEEMTYRWFAEEEVGATVLWDMADVRSHRHHGSFGMLIVEPENATWLDPVTREPIRTGTRAIIELPDGEDFREFALVWADGQYIVNPSGKCVVPRGHEADPTAPCPQAFGDPEDQGFKSVNFASEPFRWRFQRNDSEAWVFSSRVHGDPATPVFRAQEDDRVVFRVGMGADKRRGYSIQISGHEWRLFWKDPESPVKGTYSVTPGGSMDIEPRFGAGGFQNESGDYLVRAMKTRNYIEGGAWAIFRVSDDPGEIAPLPDRQPAAPTNVSASATNTSVSVSWSGVADADGYRVYRATTSGGPYTLVGETTTTEFTDDGVAAGTTYHYVVTAVDEDGNESPDSGEAVASA